VSLLDASLAALKASSPPAFSMIARKPKQQNFGPAPKLCPFVIIQGYFRLFASYGFGCVGTRIT
jgi:hypothetical protein